ncbi:hypothetical protein [Caulobacter sp. LARHSG274]
MVQTDTALDQRMRSLSRVANALRPLIEGDIHSLSAMEAISRSLDVPLRTLYTYRQKLIAGGLMTSALTPKNPGPRQGYSRYIATVDEVIPRYS